MCSFASGIAVLFGIACGFVDGWDEYLMLVVESPLYSLPLKALNHEMSAT
jgi:hypothetical protein